jgi:nicotinamidase-related amidase
MSSSADSPNTALIIVDFQKDNVGRFCQAIIPKIQLLIKRAREKKIPVIYACDSRYVDDHLFKRLGMKPHAIRGTDGVKVIDELSPAQGEIVIEKRMMSSFFGTDLDFTLREKGIRRLVITGIRTEFCFFKTVLDAFELGYDIIVPRDSCASPSEEGHGAIMKSLEFLKISTPTAEELAREL